MMTHLNLSHMALPLAAHVNPWPHYIESWPHCIEPWPYRVRVGARNQDPQGFPGM